ncbi:hypothetical protein RI065_08915 [Mycoplasmatota bacterium zrk1]
MNERVINIIDFFIMNLVIILIIINAPKLANFSYAFLTGNWIIFIYKGQWKVEKLENKSVEELKFEVLRSKLETSIIILSAVIFYFNILDYKMILVIFLLTGIYGRFFKRKIMKAKS